MIILVILKIYWKSQVLHISLILISIRIYLFGKIAGINNVYSTE